jgi:hypothetical protein
MKAAGLKIADMPEAEKARWVKSLPNIGRAVGEGERGTRQARSESLLR